MATTTFSGPLVVENKAAVTPVQSRAYVPAYLQIPMGGAGNNTVTVGLPDKSTLINLAFAHTSAFTGTDPVSAMTVTFTKGASQVIAVITCSAATLDRFQEVSTVTAAVFDTSANITIAISAVSTTTFTGGGGRVYIEYITTE